jgi:hypothetical protein
MRGRLAAGSLALIVVGTVAGCGGASSYSLARTQACFEKKGFQAVAVSNHVLAGSGGDLRIALGPAFGGEYVFLVFGHDGREATATEQRAVALAQKTFAARHLIFPRSAILAGVDVSRNVFYYSDSGPISQDVRVHVQACLR